MKRKKYLKPTIELFCTCEEQLMASLSVTVSKEKTNEDAGAKGNHLNFVDQWEDMDDK